MTAAAPHPFAAAPSAANDRCHDVLTACVDRGGEDHLSRAGRMGRRAAVFAGRLIGSLLQLGSRCARTWVGAAGRLFFSPRCRERDAHLVQGEFEGVLSRRAATTLCNVHAGAGTLPMFIIESDPR